MRNWNTEATGASFREGTIQLRLSLNCHQLLTTTKDITHTSLILLHLVQLVLQLLNVVLNLGSWTDNTSADMILLLKEPNKKDICGYINKFRYINIFRYFNIFRYINLRKGEKKVNKKIVWGRHPSTPSKKTERFFSSCISQKVRLNTGAGNLFKIHLPIDTE